MTDLDKSRMRIIKHLSAEDELQGWRRPTNQNYRDRFLRLDEYLNEKIHPHVNVGPAVAEGMWMTDHGPEHIKTVIQRIEDLIFVGDECVLSPYETYILTTAAHFHDIGNIFGRAKHERKAKKVMFDLDETYVGNDNVEKRMICSIAMAHGGKVGATGDKDTIGSLQNDTTVRKLAAILRFADELADDNTRTNRIVSRALEECAEGSKIFHLYAERLSPPIVDHDTRSVSLKFELLKEHLMDPYPKLTESAYLLDEIMARTLKTHCEQVYCSKFMVPDIHTVRTNVDIHVCTADYADIVAGIHYTLEQKGYPGISASIGEIDPTVSGLSGASVKDIVDQIPDEKADEYEDPINLIPLLDQDEK